MPLWSVRSFSESARQLDRQILGRTLLAGIRVYRVGFGWLLGGCCRYVPSCSAYAEEAIRKYGGLKGMYLATLRIARCHPFHPGGFDPVP